MNPLCIVLLAAPTTEPIPWWQTALISLIPSLGGALVALLGVWLNGHQTNKREARKSEADEISQRITKEREVIAALLASLNPMVVAVHTRYDLLAENDPNATIPADIYHSTISNTDAFIAALALARVTVTNPLARPAIRELGKQSTAVSKALTEMNDGGDASKASAQVAAFDAASFKAGRDLEHAAMTWDGRLPASVDDPEPDVQH